MNNNEQQNQMRIVYFLIIIFLFGCSQSPSIAQLNKQDVNAEHLGELTQLNPKVLHHIMEGQLYMDQSDFAMAIVELQEAQNLEPNVSAIYVSLAECYWNLNKPERSIEYLESAIEINANDIQARELMAEQYFQLKDFTKAEEQYFILSKINPENENFIFALGDLASIQKKYDQAIEYYKSAYKINNSTPQALEIAVDLAHRLGKFEEADELYQKLLLVDSTNVSYLSAYSDVKLQLDKPKEAVVLVKKLVEIDGSSTESLIQLGALYAELEYTKEAIEVFQKVIIQDSTNTAGLHFLSTIYRQNEEFDVAQIYADQMIQKYPDNPQGFVNSALIALEQEDNNKATNILSPVAADFPEDYTIQYLLGLSYYQAENYKMSSVFLNNARQIAPNSRNTIHLLAIVNDNLNNWTISDGLYQQLIQSDSTDVQALNNLAYSLAERGEKLELSKKYSQRAIELAPDQAAYLDTYGWILFKMGNNTEAIKYIEKSLGIEGENAEVLEHMGDILLKLEKVSEALEYYKKAQILEPTNQQLNDKLNEL